MSMKLGVIEKDINSFICPNYGFLVSEAVQTFLKHRFTTVALGSLLSRLTYFFILLLELLTNATFRCIFYKVDHYQQNVKGNYQFTKC